MPTLPRVKRAAVNEGIELLQRPLLARESLWPGFIEQLQRLGFVAAVDQVYPPGKSIGGSRSG